MIYGTFLSFLPFRNLGRHEYWEQIRQAKELHEQLNQQDGHHRQIQFSHVYPMVPIPDEKMPITLSFMLCLSVGIAVLFLGTFHLHLLLSAQTTIEFHGTSNFWESSSQYSEWKKSVSLIVS